MWVSVRRRWRQCRFSAFCMWQAREGKGAKRQKVDEDEEPLSLLRRAVFVASSVLARDLCLALRGVLLWLVSLACWLACLSVSRFCCEPTWLPGRRVSVLGHSKVILQPRNKGLRFASAVMAQCGSSRVGCLQHGRVLFMYSRAVGKSLHRDVAAVVFVVRSRGGCALPL